MPPKRKTAAKGAPAAPKAAPAPPKATPLAPVQNNIPKPPTPAVKQPAPPPPPPPPPPPVETPSDKVRKEWQNFISTWYEPEKKKLVDQLTKELDAKYKKANSRIQQAARNADKEKKLTEIATQLAEPAHEEWNNRLAAVQLLVDDWTDITDQEQQSVIDVFSAFYDDNEEDDDSNPFDSNETEESVASAVEEPQLPDSSPFFTIRQSPPTPVSANFQLVNPSSFFTDSISSANQARKLPELAMDNLATLNNLNTGRSQPDAGPSTSAVFGFQSWASEIGLAVPPAISQPTRNRATDNISRQASASAASSPLFSSTTAPHHSPPPKISPLAVTNNLPPGKRYIGPVIAEEEAEPIDEDLLKAKMAADFLAFKMEVRIQMIQQFHAKASAIEIDLVKQLESNNSSRECRLRTMHEHEENMMSLRESKEMERKKLCDKERDRRLQEHSFRQQVAAQKAINQTRLNASASSSKIPPATQTGWTTHSAPKLASQKENLSTGSLPTKLDPPSILKKSASARSHDIIPGFDEAAFFKAQAEAASLAKGKQPTATASASIPTGRPSALKKTESTSSQEELVELVVPAPPPTASSSAAKGKKAKKTPAVTQTSKTVTFNEEPDTDAEPPPVWGAKGARASLSSKPSKSVMIEEEPDEDADPFSAWNAKNARATTPASASASSKKGKAAAIIEEVLDEPSPVPSAFGWGSAAAATTTKKGKAPIVSAEPVEEPFQTWTAPAKKGKAPIVSAEPTEEPFQTWTAPAKKGKSPIISAEPVEDPFQTWTAPTWGSASTKKPKVTVTEEVDEEAGPSLAWGAGLKSASSASKQAKKVVPQPEPPRSVQSSFSKTAWVQDVGEEEEEEEEGEEEEGWDQIQPSSATDTTGEEGDAWGAAYWGNLTNGQPVSQVADESAQHMRWTPSMDAEESGDEDSGDMEESMGSALWMQYAISGGDVPGFEAQAPDPQEHVHAHAHVPVKTTPAPSHKKTTNDPTTSIWEQGKGKKKIAPANETIKVETTRAQQASASSSARTAQWPKAKMEMENWASRLGQSSGSARHL